jgi:hypothetical protein
MTTAELEHSGTIGQAPDGICVEGCYVGTFDVADYFPSATNASSVQTELIVPVINLPGQRGVRVEKWLPVNPRHRPKNAFTEDELFYFLCDTPHAQTAPDNLVGDIISPAGPPAEIVAHFWETFGHEVPSYAIVSASATELDTNSVMTAFDEPLKFPGVPARAFLFFVDLDPYANWGHICAYAFVSTLKETFWRNAESPPHESIILKRLAA